MKENAILPVLTEMEMSVLRRRGMRTFHGASGDERAAEVSLIDKALIYESENNLLDERLGFTRDCDLLVWFASRYGLEVRMEQEGIIID